MSVSISQFLIHLTSFFFVFSHTAQPALLAFPEERPVFLREYSTNHYAVGSYFVSRLIVEAVITFIQMALAVS